MTRLVLLCFRDINRKQKEISSNALDINTNFNTILNNRIMSIHRSKLDQLPHEQKVAVLSELYTNRVYQQQLTQATNTLDIDDPSTELLEMRFDRLKIESKTASSIKVENIIKAVLGDFGPHYNWLKELREQSNDRNRMLIDQHVDNVKAGLELDNLIENSRDSLIDDYANTSTEMPSYMDPED